MTFLRLTRWLPVVLALLATQAWTAVRGGDSEDELKAAAVWLFVQYSSLTPGADGAITVGVVGRPAFEEILRRTLEGKSKEGHVVRVGEAKNDLHGLQILYVATDKTAAIEHALQSARAQHILTISDSGHFLEMGGAVSLYIADGHIAFEASLEALDLAGVTISSNLLKFGQVHGHRKAQEWK